MHLCIYTLRISHELYVDEASTQNYKLQIYRICEVLNKKTVSTTQIWIVYGVIIPRLWFKKYFFLELRDCEEWVVG